jgi:K(+)-stimulated pyrophosphate-energized sodium pump
MNNIASGYAANSADWAVFRRRFYTVATIVAALLALFWLLGYGPGGSVCKAGALTGAAPCAPTAAAAAAAPAPAPSPTATPAAAGTPKVVVYFDSGKADLPAGADKSLVDVVAALKANANAKAQLSGFHDPSGNVAQNEELALNRARAVRSALETAGIARDRVVMAKPAVTTGSGDAREALRVEVTVQ